MLSVPRIRGLPIVRLEFMFPRDKDSFRLERVQVDQVPVGHDVVGGGDPLKENPFVVKSKDWKK